MIVKFFSRGGGSCKSTMDYLLGKDRQREKAVLLQGNPNLTEKLADSLQFKNRYTVGVLSFEENNISEKDKRNIMKSFESSLLSGLEEDQYDITWIEHTDKDRLELNFVIPNVELASGKRLQPYYDRVDRPLVENWKQVTNHDFGLTDPHDPSKAQAFKSLNSQDLPHSQGISAIKERIGLAISEQISQGSITDRKGVLDTLENAGFDIARVTKKSISIKNPQGKRNIRLEGFIYEDRRLDADARTDHRTAKERYTATSTERYTIASNKLQRAVEVKRESNRTAFRCPYDAFKSWQHQNTGNLDRVAKKHSEIARNATTNDRASEKAVTRNINEKSDTNNSIYSFSNIGDYGNNYPSFDVYNQDKEKRARRNENNDKSSRTKLHTSTSARDDQHQKIQVKVCDSDQTVNDGEELHSKKQYTSNRDYTIRIKEYYERLREQITQLHNRAREQVINQYTEVTERARELLFSTERAVDRSKSTLTDGEQAVRVGVNKTDEIERQIESGASKTDEIEQQIESGAWRRAEIEQQIEQQAKIESIQPVQTVQQVRITKANDKDNGYDLGM